MAGARRTSLGGAWIPFDWETTMRWPKLALVMGLTVKRALKFARDRSLWIVTSTIVTVGMAVTVTVLGLTPADGGMMGGTLVLVDSAQAAG